MHVKDNILLQVTEDGTYIPPKNPKLAYGAMTLYRSQMLIITASYLARASTIAVRYSAVRRQTEIKPGYYKCFFLITIQV